MRLSVLTILCLCFVSTIVATRTFKITNNCGDKIWLGIQGNPLISNGGLEINARSSRNIDVPDKWVSGRIWPRTGCKSVNAKLTCATGDCGTPTNGFSVECKGIGGQPPATLAEFTLDGWGGSDYYDLSNVDGHSVGMTIRPIPGQYTTVNNPSFGKYNCGTATCTFDAIYHLRQPQGVIA